MDHGSFTDEETADDIGVNVQSDMTKNIAGSVQTDTAADAEEVNGIMSSNEDWSYMVNDAGEAVIVGFASGGSYATIPSEIDDKQVTSIVPGVFSGNTNIYSVTMPGTIKTLPSGIFTGCTNLNYAYLYGVTQLPEGLFKGCSELSKLVIDEGVTDIPASLCEGCDSGLDVYIPLSVKTIGENAFKDCMTSSYAELYYAGSEEDWQKVSIAGTGNEVLSTVDMTYNKSYIQLGTIPNISSLEDFNI